MAVHSRIPAYFSHSYRPEDRHVNDFFWNLFWKQGFSFTVDPKSEALSIPYLELMMKRSACFVAVVTKRYEQPYYKCSPFILHEYGLAVQAQKPRVIFVENEVAGSFFTSDPNVFFFNRQRLSNNRDYFSDQIAKLAERSRPYLSGLDRPLGKVGLLLPKTDSPYVELRASIEDLLKSQGFDPEELRQNLENTFEFAKYFDEFDFVILDIDSPALPSWIYPFMQGRFIPTVKLVQRASEQVAPQTLPIMAVSKVLSEVAASDEVVLYWNTKEELLRKLQRELTKLGRDRRQFTSQAEGTKYFRSLGRAAVPIFISNASDANDFVSHLARTLSLENMLYFHYRFRNTIELGTNWAEALNEKVKASAVFVPLITQEYWNSKWCVTEYELAKQRADRGNLRIVPYFLEEAGTQVAQQGKPLIGLSRTQQIREIVRDLDGLMTDKYLAASARIESVDAIEKRRTYNLDTPVDVAIITILPEEYGAVLKHMKNHGRVISSDTYTNLHSWEMGEIESPNHDTPYRVVLAMAPHSGNNSAAIVTTNTVEAFNPAYVMLVGIAGGLGPIRHGDVVVSDRIWGYEYGKVEKGFNPRPDWNYPVDASIVTAANTLPALEATWSDMISETPPQPSTRPKVIVGPVASGEKVVDDTTDRFFRPVLKLWPKLAAIEMEGVGAASAIQNAREMGRRVGFAMVRGISDKPRTKGQSSAGEIEAGPQTQERDSWKPYASEAAAVLTVQLIRLAWPRKPRGEEGGAGLAV